MGVAPLNQGDCFKFCWLKLLILPTENMIPQFALGPRPLVFKGQAIETHGNSSKDSNS